MERQALVAAASVAMAIYARLPFLHGVVRRVVTR
jgi:hypothetical protein